jgi:hypothetical protein
MKKGQLSLPQPNPFQPFPSIPSSKLLVTDSLRGFNSNISEVKMLVPAIHVTTTEVWSLTPIYFIGLDFSVPRTQTHCCKTNHAELTNKHFLYFVKWSPYQIRLIKGVGHIPLHAMMALEGVRMNSSYSFMTSALDGVEWSAPRPAALWPGERTTGIYCTGGWVGLRAGLDTEVRGKIFAPAEDPTPIARRFSL